jgi:hypothetical protein
VIGLQLTKNHPPHDINDQVLAGRSLQSSDLDAVMTIEAWLPPALK